ncbi:MAG: signal peptidase II [Alphaproteobacteria bacterium]
MKVIYTFLIALTILVADQVSKIWMLDFLIGGDVTRFNSVEVLPFFNLVTVWNQGVSFGLFSNDTDIGPYLLIALSVIIAVGFAVWAFRTQDKFHHIGIAMVIGGAIGNVIDRFRFGAVFDFLDVHVAGYHWPAFNIADSAICVGVFILMLYAFLFEKNVQGGENI